MKKQFTEKDNVISSKVEMIGPGSGGMFKNLLSKDKKNAMDEGGVNDLNELGLTGTNISAVTQNNPRWTAFIGAFKNLYNEDILLAEVEKPSELIGFSKKAEEFLKNNTEITSFSTKDIELKPKIVRVKEIQDSINRRIAKITTYWSKGNKKNSLYLACGVCRHHPGRFFHERVH